MGDLSLENGRLGGIGEFDFVRGGCEGRYEERDNGRVWFRGEWCLRDG